MDSRSLLMDNVRTLIRSDNRPFKVIAKEIGVAPSTINNIFSGKTRWPRPTTLFPLLHHYNCTLTIKKL